MRPDGAPDGLTGNVRGQRIPDGTPAEIGQHHLLCPGARVTIPQGLGHPSPQLNFAHRVTIRQNTSAFPGTIVCPKCHVPALIVYCLIIERFKRF